MSIAKPNTYRFFHNGCIQHARNRVSGNYSKKDAENTKMKANGLFNETLNEETQVKPSKDTKTLDRLKVFSSFSDLFQRKSNLFNPSFMDESNFLKDSENTRPSHEHVYFCCFKNDFL